MYPKPEGFVEPNSSSNIPSSKSISFIEIYLFIISLNCTFCFQAITSHIIKEIFSIFTNWSHHNNFIFSNSLSESCFSWKLLRCKRYLYNVFSFCKIWSMFNLEVNKTSFKWLGSFILNRLSTEARNFRADVNIIRNNSYIIRFINIENQLSIGSISNISQVDKQLKFICDDAIPIPFLIS